MNLREVFADTHRRRQTAEIKRLRALVRAALLHRAGRPGMLLFAMRERWNDVALRELGFDSLDAFLRSVQDPWNPGRTAADPLTGPDQGPRDGEPS